MTVRRRTAPVLVLLLLLLGSLGAPASLRAHGPDVEVAPPRDLVVLVHGMGRSSISMVPLSWTLKRAGYDVLNWGYSSTCCGIAELGSQLQSDLREHRGGERRVHFVGHSLGNIIIRWVLAHDDYPVSTGRVVMLAPPNQGALAADRMSPAFGWLLKPLSELQTESMRETRELMVPEPVELAVVAGRYDGKVSVAETRLDGMDAHAVVPAAHTFLMFRSDVRRLVVEFLRHGEFLPTS